MHNCLATIKKITQLIFFSIAGFTTGLISAQPVGVSWQWVNPLPNGNPIKSIAYDGTNFVAVGSNQSVRTSPTTLAGSWSAEVSLGSGTANDIIWAGTLFVLVGDNGVIKTSPDGITWSTQNSTTTNNLKSVVWTGTTLVVVGDNSTVLASVDAINWAAGTLPSASNLNGIAWNGSLLAAAGTIGKIYTSADAINWTERVAAAGTTFNDITASGQSFVAVGNSGAIYSSNSLGTVWNQQSNGFGLFNLISAAWDGSQFIAAGSSGLVITSPLGLTWSLTAQVGNGGSISDILVLATAVAAGQYFMVGDGGVIYSSSDLVNWTLRQPETSAVGDSNFDDISFNGSQYLAVGVGTPVAGSTDGISWSQLSTNAYASVVWDGAQYVGVGNSTKTGTSPDGITWTDHNLPFNFNLQKVIIAHNGSYIAVSSLGEILTSIDANTWVQQTSPTSSVLNGIAASTTTTVIVGADGTAITSTDLANWTQQTLPNLGVKELTGIVFGNNEFVAVGTTSLIYTSPDGTTWTERSLVQPHNFLGVTWDGNQYLAVGTQGEILTSVDAITWTVQTSVTVNDLSAITSDGTKGVAVGTLGTIVLSQAVNQAPVPTAPTFSINEDTSGTSQISPNDPDLGDTFSYAVTTAAANGTATVNATGLASYVPSANFNGSDSFVVRVTDAGGLNNSITINVTVNPVNDPPAPTAPNLIVNENMSGTVQVTTNDPDIGDSFTYSLTTAPSNGSASVNATGLVSYTPNANFNGSDTITVLVSDAAGATGNVAINVTINSVNQPPVPTASPLTTNEDTTGSVTVLANDPDVGDTITFNISTPAVNGSATINAAGQATYSPDANFNGSDTFTVTATDAGGLAGTVTVDVTIAPVNDAPTISASAFTVMEGSSGTLQLTVTDPDAGDTFTYAITTPSTNGTESVDTNGVVSYTPNPKFSGSDTFTVTVTDAGGLTGAVTVDVTVNPVNNPPEVTIPTITVNGRQVSMQINVTDPDPGDTHTFTISTPPQHGTATVSTSGLVNYTADSGYLGDDSLTVTVTDSGGASVQVSASFSITENAVSNIETNVSDNGTRGGSMGWILGFLFAIRLFRNLPKNTLLR